ncbi:MAG: DUF309 domain-containing protein [bacterium]
MIDISEGITLFNNLEFFEAHDFFEKLWISADRKDKLFLQGLIQISVGCFHTISKNKSGAISQFGKGTKKLLNYQPLYNGVNVEKLLFGIEQIKFCLKSISEEFTWEISFPKIEFNISNK